MSHGEGYEIMRTPLPNSAVPGHYGPEMTRLLSHEYSTIPAGRNP